MPLVLGAAVLIAGAALFIGFSRPAPVGYPAAADVAAAMTDVPVTAVAEIRLHARRVRAPHRGTAVVAGEPITPEQARLLAIWPRIPSMDVAADRSP